jgi:hypothetical protein
MERMKKRPMPFRTSRSPVQTPGLRVLRVFAANRWDSRQEAQEAQNRTAAGGLGVAEAVRLGSLREPDS